MNILVFKTNLTNKRKVGFVQALLDVHPLIQQWNVDLHDRDKVLRIVTTGVEVVEVQSILTDAGYFCEEME